MNAMDAVNAMVAAEKHHGYHLNQKPKPQCWLSFLSQPKELMIDHLLGVVHHYQNHGHCRKHGSKGGFLLDFLVTVLTSIRLEEGRDDL